MTQQAEFDPEWSGERRLQYFAELRICREVPSRYRSADTDNHVATAWIDDPHDALYIAGPVGAGKSHLAWALVRRWLLRHPKLAFQGWQTGYLLHHLRPGNAKVIPAVPSTWQMSGTPEIIINHFQDVCSANLLLLEDLGAENLSGWALEQLTAIIDARYSAELATIYTTNVAPRELAGRVGERIASRITHNATVVPIIGADRRRVAA